MNGNCCQTLIQRIYCWGISTTKQKKNTLSSLCGRITIQWNHGPTMVADNRKICIALFFPVERDSPRTHRSNDEQCLRADKFLQFLQVHFNRNGMCTRLSHIFRQWWTKNWLCFWTSHKREHRKREKKKREQKTIDQQPLYLYRNYETDGFFATFTHHNVLPPIFFIKFIRRKKENLMAYGSYVRM